MWYYTLNDQQAGPITQAELIQMLQSSLPSDTLVWKEGMPDWVMASTLDELQAPTLSPNSPPALAPAVAPPASGNPYSSPTASSFQNYQSGDYPLPKVKKASFGLLMALIIIGTLTMVGGYGAMIVSTIQTASAMEHEYDTFEPEIEQLDPAELEELATDEDTDAPSDDPSYDELSTLSENEDTYDIDSSMSPIDPNLAIYSVVGFIGIIIMGIGGIVGLVYVHRAWQLLQPTQTTITPGQAVGFMFIPLFNLYWLFVAYHKWAVEWNNTCRKHPSLAYAPKGSEGAFLAMAICYCASIILSFLGILASSILYIIGMKSMCDAINFAAENGTPPQQALR